MKIFVDIYLAKNVGDDLFLKILAEKFPEVQFIINYYGNEYDEFVEKYPNIIRPAYPLPYRVLNRLHVYDYINDARRISKSCDACLLLGGSIFREESYWKSVYAMRMKLAQAFGSQNKPVLVLGANFGPYYSDEFLRSYKKFFSLCYDVCFREQYSYNLFRDIPVVRYEKDIVFQLGIKTERTEKKQVCYSVIDPNHVAGLQQYREQYLDWLKESILWNISRGYRCILISFCQAEGDLEVCQELLTRFNDVTSQQIDVLTYTGDLEKIFSCMAESEIIIASRFHAVILALILKKKFLPLVYSQKTINVLQDLNYPHDIVPISQCINYEIKPTMQALQQSVWSWDIDTYRGSAERQFDRLRELVEQET